MKTDTPRTDEMAWPETGLIEGHFARELERELNAARAEIEKLTEQLNQHKQSLASTDIHNNQIAVKLEQVTEQRDRLAEALREITTYDPSDGQCNSGYSCKYIAEQALQSLTTNEL